MFKNFSSSVLFFTFWQMFDVTTSTPEQNETYLHQRKKSRGFSHCFNLLFQLLHYDK